MRTSADVVRDLNRKLTAAILEQDQRPDTRPTLDDVLCAVAFVAFVAFICLL